MKKLFISCLIVTTEIYLSADPIDKILKDPKKDFLEIYQHDTSKTYTIGKLLAAHSLAEKQKKEWQEFVQDIDQSKIQADKNKFGPIHDNDYFIQLHLPLFLSAQIASSKFGNKPLSVTQCPDTAVDIFSFVKQNDEFRLIIIGKYIPHLQREKYAPTGGITEYGETFERTAVREAQEEAHIDLDENKLLLLGTRSDPNRDPRGQHITSIFYGCITDQIPQPSDEAANVYLATQQGIENTTAEDWCALDHREMALTAFSRLKDIIEKSKS